jgi:hypothetical protein
MPVVRSFAYTTGREAKQESKSHTMGGSPSELRQDTPEMITEAICGKFLVTRMKRFLNMMTTK